MINSAIFCLTTDPVSIVQFRDSVDSSMFMEILGPFKLKKDLHTDAPVKVALYLAQLQVKNFFSPLKSPVSSHGKK